MLFSYGRIQSSFQHGIYQWLRKPVSALMAVLVRIFSMENILVTVVAFTAKARKSKNHLSKISLGFTASQILVMASVCLESCTLDLTQSCFFGTM
jgi:hypothetical protein